MTERFRFKGTGEVYSFTIPQNNSVIPEGFESQAPYVLALVKLKEGPLIITQLTDVDFKDIHIGMPVEMVTRKLTDEGQEGVIVYGYKFKPPIDSQT